MTIYEVKCRRCHVKHLIDSRKHMYRRFEPNGDSGIYILCQSTGCNKLFRINSEDLKEVKDLDAYYRADYKLAFEGR